MRWPIFIAFAVAALGLAAPAAIAGDVKFKYQLWSGQSYGLGFGSGQYYGLGVGNIHDHGHGHGYGHGFGYGYGQGYYLGQGPYSWPAYGPSTFSPGNGVICYATQHACYGSHGFDQYVTMQYFGAPTGIFVQRYPHQPYTNSPSYVFPGGRLFWPMVGIVCDRSTRTCADKRGMDAHWTGKLFGDSYEDRVKDWRGADAFKPTSGVVCDNRHQVCSSTRGVEPGLTEFFYGQSASNGFHIIDGPNPLFNNERPKPAFSVE